MCPAILIVLYRALEVPSQATLRSHKSYFDNRMQRQEEMSKVDLPICTELAMHSFLSKDSAHLEQVTDVACGKSSFTASLTKI